MEAMAGRTRGRPKSCRGGRKAAGMFEAVFPLVPGDSGGSALVSMTKAPDHRYGDDAPELEMHNGSSDRRVIPRR